MGYVGQPVRRKEDVRLLTGRGTFVDDVALPDTVHAVFLRSPHAHARIVRIDTQRAAKLPGVLRILTGADWVAAGLGELKVGHPMPFYDGRSSNSVNRPVLAVQEVRHVGDNVALIVAETLDQALDAAAAIEVDYQEFIPCVEVKRALDATAPVVHRSLQSNLRLERRIGNEADVLNALKTCFHVAELEITANRLAPSSIEPRAYLGWFDPARDSYTLWTTSQTPHMVRSWLAQDSLKVPQHKIRVVAPDVGGGFGMKLYHYPEQPAVLWASKLVGRPVRWRSSRSEAFLSDTQARDHHSKARMGFDRDGRIRAFHVDTIANMGAYESTFASSICAGAYPSVLAGPYTNRNLFIRLRTAYTNTVPLDAYRGAGSPEAIFILHRLVVICAQQIGIDVTEHPLR